MGADDSQLLFRHWLDAYIQHGYYDVDGIHAKEVILWSCAQ